MLVIALLCSSCVMHKGLDPVTGKYRGEIDNVVKGGTVTVAQIKEAIGDDVKIDSLHYDDKLLYDVDFYHVSYFTQYGLEGSLVASPKMVYARALLLIPHGVSADNVRLAAYFHGTVLPVPEFTDIFGMGTPSDFTGDNGSQDVRHCGLPLASAGYCVILPEYTGYGPTANLDHPFVYYPELWLSSFDALEAGVRAMKDEKYGIGIDPGKKIWLSGWSQGGGMALYAQKMLENDPFYKGKFEVQATSTLAGPFNMTRFLGDMLKNKKQIYLMMPLYGWAGYAINLFCPDLQRPMDQIFRPAIYDQIDAFLQFGSTPADMFQEFFIEHMLDGTDPAFAKALEQDSTCSSWDPVAPVFMHHGEKDSIVPCFNSQDAYAGLKDRAANGVELHIYPGQDHATFVPTYMSKTIEEFNSVL